MRVALIIALAGLASAGPAAARSGAFAGEFNLVGTEPFWDAQIRPRWITLKDDAETMTLRGRNNGPVVRGGVATWRVVSGETRFRIVLKRTRCDDGMTERIFAYEAKVLFDAGGKLEGCAARPRR